jgi:hypothetical protein
MEVAVSRPFYPYRLRRLIEVDLIQTDRGARQGAAGETGRWVLSITRLTGCERRALL